MIEVSSARDFSRLQAHEGHPALHVPFRELMADSSKGIHSRKGNTPCLVHGGEKTSHQRHMQLAIVWRGNMWLGGKWWQLWGLGALVLGCCSQPSWAQSYEAQKYRRGTVKRTMT